MSYRTGFTEGRLRDATRSDWDGVSSRPVVWSCWYPVGDEGGEAERRPYEREGASPFVQAAVVRDAELSGARREWPLVLLSHGAGGSADGLSWLAEHLVRSGYVCIGVNHHGNTATEPYRVEGFVCWWERALDLSFVLDRLDEFPRLDGRVDRRRIGAVGYSLGGHTTLSLVGAITSMALYERWSASSGIAAASGPREFPELAGQVPKLHAESAVLRRSWERHGEPLEDPRVSRCVAIAPAPPVRAFTSDSLSGITQPVLLLGGEADTEAPYDECAGWLSRTNPLFTLRSLGERVGHYTFLPECTAQGRELEPVLCEDNPGVVRPKVHAEAATMIRAFLDADDDFVARGKAGSRDARH